MFGKGDLPMFELRFSQMLACLLPHHVPLKTHKRRVELGLHLSEIHLYIYLSYNWTGAEVPRALRQLQSKWLILGELADDPVSAQGKMRL